jgi:hypothetical protein
LVAECTGGATLTAIGDNTTDHVGPPLVDVEVKLVDVPDMDYKASEGFGEVCIKGKIIMPGYYKLPEKTKEALDDEGWLHTGDVGTWTEVRKRNPSFCERSPFIFLFFLNLTSFSMKKTGNDGLFCVEWLSENYRSQEKSLQAEPGRVHCTGKTRTVFWQIQNVCPSFC